MPRMRYVEARNQAIAELMARDERVILIGGDFNSPFSERNDLRQRFPGRVFDEAISEMGYAGAAIGAALGGMRPIVDFSTASFMFNAWEQVVNEAPNLCYMSAGRICVPVVFHILAGARGAGGAQHSHSPQAMLWNTPGLKILIPATPADVVGLLQTAVADPNPCVFVDHIRLFQETGEVPEQQGPIPFGQACIRRPGEDVTVVACGAMVPQALQAAEQLAAEGLEAEVIDPRTLVPFDLATVLASVKRTGRLVVVDETHLSAGVAAEIIARVVEQGVRLRSAPRRVATLDVPVPYSPVEEAYVVPSAERIAQAIRAVVQQEIAS
ncbi:MAG: alpha-ketoacid dehydrogenase subunit beta [Alicyclobacillus sp.]|nr:alpha-ketoacid dehydrogenase subunit beta [Alicyclobacillus sp.]